MASYRHLARTCVMQTLFASEFMKQGKLGDDLDTPPKELLTQLLKEFAPKMTSTDFAFQTLEGVLSHKDEIDKLIVKYAPEWPFEKIAGVDRAILEIGIYEILYAEEIPAVVAINEAIEIAKHHGDKNSPKFINGVLSSVMNDNKKDE